MCDYCDKSRRNMEKLVSCKVVIEIEFDDAMYAFEVLEDIRSDYEIRKNDGFPPYERSLNFTGWVVRQDG